MDNLFDGAVSELKKKSIELNLLQKLTSGKEATVYLMGHGDKRLALKVYKDHLKRSFQSNQEYLAGKFVRKHSERKAMKLRNKFGRNLTHKLWVKREFYMLKKLYSLGASIPCPIEMTTNSILMEYIGDKKHPAPKLSEISPAPVEAKIIYSEILKNIDLFYESGIVHGDLSPFNILYWGKKVFIIDFPQSIDVRSNPNAETMLERDKENIKKWFQKASNP